jgi:isochorismate synthase EntC
MPAGKPAGVVCVHLAADLTCGLFADTRRPSCCASFAPEPALCGSSREEALANLRRLEALTLPG